MSHLSKHQKRTKRRAQSHHHLPRSTKFVFVVGAVATLALLTVHFVLSDLAVANATPVVAASDGEIHIPAGDFRIGHAKFFEYKSSGSKAVRFFVMKSSDGVYSASVDACRRCFRDKKGYRQDGDDVVCNKCGRRFLLTDMQAVASACSPNAIPRKVEGNTILVAATDLEAQSVLF